MSLMNERDAVWMAETGLYLLLEALLLAWAFTTDYELDTGAMGLGIIDPFFTLAMIWIGVVFSTKSTIAFLKRKSYRGLSDEWKGPLTDIKPYKFIKAETHDGKTAVNQLAIYPTGGTSKPSVRGMTGTKFLIFPEFYSMIFGGYVIIMAKLQTYNKGSHGDLLSHIVNKMSRIRGYKFNNTKIAVGEDYDPKFAVEIDNEWVVKETLTVSSNLMAEASINRKHNDMMEDSYRTRMQLRKYGYKPEEEI